MYLYLNGVKFVQFWGGALAPKAPPPPVGAPLLYRVILNDCDFFS
jgi:hypothetical protein